MLNRREILQRISATGDVTAAASPIDCIAIAASLGQLGYPMSDVVKLTMFIDGDPKLGAAKWTSSVLTLGTGSSLEQPKVPISWPARRSRLQRSLLPNSWS